MIFSRNKEKHKQETETLINMMSAKIEKTPDDPSFYYERAKLYLQIEEPESALNDCIAATKLDRRYIKRCKVLCGRYHPILCEKFMSALFYVIDPGQVKPFVRDK